MGVPRVGRVDIAARCPYLGKALRGLAAVADRRYSARAGCALPKKALTESLEGKKGREKAKLGVDRRSQVLL